MLLNTNVQQQQKAQNMINYRALIVINKKIESYDPTRTTVLRNTFIKDIDRRFNILLRDIRQAIIEDDCFGLKPVKHDIKIINIHGSPGKEAFKFNTSTEKVNKFMDFVHEQESKGLLQTTTITQLGQPVEQAWTNMYIQDSYKRGVIRSRYEMGKAGMPVPPMDQTGGIVASMSTPFHADRVGMLYSRTFTDLKGITSAMDTQFSRILSQAMIDGDNPGTIVKKLTDATNISRNRAHTLARTEITRAHHVATIQEYRNYAAAGVVVRAEWATAGFGVCDKCSSLEGREFTLDEIEGMIPFHPNCRCLALPTMPVKPEPTLSDLAPTKKVLADTQKLMDLARESGDEVYNTSVAMSKKYGGYSTPINYKGKNSIIRKTMNDSPTKNVFDIKDGARTTMIIPDDQMENVYRAMLKDKRFVSVKLQKPDKYDGYSGILANMKTKNGLVCEIQANTSKMIYGKEPPNIAKMIIGEDEWNMIFKATGLDGGKGHKYYEEMRVLIHDSTKHDYKLQEYLRYQELRKQSQTYYTAFRTYDIS